jgi:hypothetical protein
MDPSKRRFVGPIRNRRRKLIMWKMAHFSFSAHRSKDEEIPYRENNRVCYDFKKRRLVPTHYAVRTNGGNPGGSHLTLWLVEISVDGGAGDGSPKRKTTGGSTADILQAG